MEPLLASSGAPASELPPITLQLLGNGCTQAPIKVMTVSHDCTALATAACSAQQQSLMQLWSDMPCPFSRGRSSPGLMAAAWRRALQFRLCAAQYLSSEQSSATPMQAELGDIVYVELPEVGSEVTKSEQFGVVESVKASMACWRL